MLPTKQKKPSLWRGFMSFGARQEKSASDTYSSGLPNLFDDREAHAKVLSDLNKPNVKRRRTFTGLIKMSDAGMPKNDVMMSRAMKLGIALFIAVDIMLIIFFLKTF